MSKQSLIHFQLTNYFSPNSVVLMLQLGAETALPRVYGVTCGAFMGRLTSENWSVEKKSNQKLWKRGELTCCSSPVCPLLNGKQANFPKCCSVIPIIHVGPYASWCSFKCFCGEKLTSFSVTPPPPPLLIGRFINWQEQMVMMMMFVCRAGWMLWEDVDGFNSFFSRRPSLKMFRFNAKCLEELKDELYRNVTK